MSQPPAEPPGQDDPGVQLLTPEGRLVADPRHPLDLDLPAVQGLLRDMTLLRRFDAEATALQRQGELGLWASCLGQEAAQIGAGRALAPADFAFASYREHGVAWCRGVRPAQMLRFWRGSAHGGWDPQAAGMGNYTVIIGAQALHAVGYAMGIQRDGADAAAMAFFGDGATSQGDVAEAFTFAAVSSAPVVFFCQNNQWAISEPLSRQTRVPLWQRAHGFGFPGVRVDGNDVLAVLAVTRAALAQARAGGGPTLVEAFTYRMGAHTTSDDPSRYRDAAEVDQWRARDPLLRVERYLRAEGVEDAWFADLAAEADDLAVGVRAEARALPDTDPLAVFDLVYAERHPVMARQRAELAAHLASFAGPREAG
ncbi:pyruvate dehydrogenase (acetyl-transferring) E1 component subunit alpha [Geodermatophilus sp. CPCC 206100]|uniref:pyruvate dehydrogenase (acetyl-transferring) E1 component subunit alpha n=1 Tax=Geodermatophilus sp. CPCC 206100 TaxID=3020054 RepID=UPI003B009B87